MRPQLAISVLPDGSQEFVDPALLDGIDPAHLTEIELCVDDAHEGYGELVPKGGIGEAFLSGRTVTSRTRFLPGHLRPIVLWTRFRYPEISSDLPTQHRYEEMRRKGESHAMAELLAVRKFPSFKTDSTFNKGRVNGSQFEDCPLRGDWLKARAEEAGVSTTGKFYSSGLARFPGDPKAWISDRNDVLRVARENGMSVSGDVNYTAPESAPVEDVDVAPEILAREVDAYLAANPDARRGDAEEVVREVITGQVDKHEPLVQE